MAPVLRHCPCLRPENDDVRLLDYSHSNLDDVPNEVFGYERTLEELFLDANQIKDLPRPLFHCHGLRKLNLCDNEIQTLPPAIASLINLEYLDISKNGVLEIPENIKGCKCLTVIDASVNPLGKLPEGFTFLINLHELYLNDTFLEYLPANFGRLAHLRILELRENHLKLLPKSMARLVELCRLDIGQNDFADLPEVIGNLPRLVELWCDCNNLSCLPPFLGGLKKLAYLDASKNKIYEVADEIEGCISLCDLTLSSNRIKVLPDGIANLRRLTVLRVDENRMVSVPEAIGNLCNLEELVLSSNNLKSLPPSLGLLRNLRTLIADDNLLEELPSEIGSCLKLTILSLRDNKLVEIPDELGHITALKVINLSGNLLQYLPFSIAKLPNLQALWLSENQNKPLIPLQSDTDRATGQKVLTCFMLPQVPLDEEVIDVPPIPETSAPEGGRGRHIIKFAFDAEKDQPSKLVRAPTPYPKELKAHARHARNYALKKQGSKDSEGNDVVADEAQAGDANDCLHSKGATPDIMILPTLPPKENNSLVKEASVIKPKSPLSSPPKHERHYIPNIKDPSHEIELKQHAFLEQNPLQISHQLSSDIIGADIASKVLGRRDSRGDGSSSENTSTSAAGSPKLTPDGVLVDGCNHPIKMDKDGLFKKNVPPPGKRDTWMRQRLLKQGSGDSDRGYRSDQEVYVGEKEPYGQGYHDGYASDWEAFLAKQNHYNPPSNPDSLQGSPHFARHSQGELDYRGHAEGQEIKADEEREGFAWDNRYHYPSEGGPVVADEEEYQARMAPPYANFWQMDPATGQYYPPYDMSHSFPPPTDNSPYGYAQNQMLPEPPPAPPQPYYEDCDGYKHITPQYWMQQQQPPHPPVILNNPGTIPRRLGAASPRLKRSQCLSVQAPLHGTPQEYHLIPHQPALRPVLPNSSPRPGRSPSPGGMETRPPVQYSPQPYQKFPPHFQPPYPGYPITTQPMNSSQFPRPAQYQRNNYQTSPYPTLPPSPRMKIVGYSTSTVDDSALVSPRPYPMASTNLHNFYSMQGDVMDPVYHHHRMQSLGNAEMFDRTQDAEYGVVSPTSLQFRSGSIPAQMQCIDDCDAGAMQHLHRSVPSINIIPSTSPPQMSYMTHVEGWKGDLSNSHPTSVHSSNATKSEFAVPPDTDGGVANAESRDTFEQKSGSSHENRDSLEESNSQNLVESSTLNRNKSVEKVTDVYAQNSNSYTVISPKPTKIVQKPNVNSNSLQPIANKDFQLPPHDGQRNFQRPGCFQAVPVIIPGVHSVARKKEIQVADPTAEREKLESSLHATSEQPVTNNIPQNSKDLHNFNQTPLPIAPNPASDALETKKNSSYVGGIISHINKTLKPHTKEPSPDPKSNLSNSQKHSAEVRSKMENGQPEKTFTNSSCKPGHPVKVCSKPTASPPVDKPPNLPKKDYSAVTMRNIAPPQNAPSAHPPNSPSNIHKQYSETTPKTDRQKAVSGSNPDHPNYSNVPDRISWEDRKTTAAQLVSESATNKKPVRNGNEKNDVQSNESNKHCSTDKRFQKVLPPIDKSFHLKPASARRTPSPTVELSGNDVPHQQIENSRTPSAPPSPKPRAPTSKESEPPVEPPKIPPKRSSMGAMTVFGDDVANPRQNENNPERTVIRQLSRTKSLQEDNEQVNNELNRMSKMKVDVLQAKDVNNEINEQLQKGNMPDLISRIAPDEKNEFIIMEQQTRVLRSAKSEEDELSKDNFSFSKEGEKDGGPESPKSPKRQSWFFGSHKNSLVFPVIVSRNPELGFSIEGGVGSPRNPSKPYDNGIYVAHVLDDGPANNLLRAGDKILQVDGKDFSQLDHNKAVAVLQEAGATVSLMVSRQ